MKQFLCTHCYKVFKGYKHKTTAKVFCSQKCYWLDRKTWVSNRKGTKMTLEQRTRMSNARMGENNGNWRGGDYINSKTARYREMNTIRYKEWRKAVFERDNYTCQECGAKCGDGKDVVLNADHIQQWAYFPELRYKLSNGRTLCEPCHRKTATWGANKMGKRQWLIVMHSEDFLEYLKYKQN